MAKIDTVVLPKGVPRPIANSGESASIQLTGVFGMDVFVTFVDSNDETTATKYKTTPEMPIEPLGILTADAYAFCNMGDTSILVQVD